MKKMKKIYCATFLFLLLSDVCLLHILMGEKKQSVAYESDLSDADSDKTGDQSDPLIRVLIRTNGYADTAHASVSLRTQGRFIIEWNGGQKTTKKGSLTLHPDDSCFQKGTVRIRPKDEGEKIHVKSLKRGYKTPAYRGELELYPTAEGIVIINELSLEDYLQGVLPSEMPYSYEEEALKAQAVCARNYAACQKKSYAYPEYQAHVDDSTAFQVYNNSAENPRTDRAVKETAGEMLYYQGRVVTTYYYSTSCGKTTDLRAWGTKRTKKNAYLKSVSVWDENRQDYERGLAWYRWHIDMTLQEMENTIELNTGVQLGTLKNVVIEKTGAGGVALRIKAEGTEGDVTIKTENKIRKALGSTSQKIIRQDQSSVQGTGMLPSAFITIEKNDNGYRICGGGYGHGIGMSQNGANEMAKNGKNYKEILRFFYSGVEIK